MGGTESYSLRGIIPRSIQQVFQEIASRSDQSFDVSLSVVEIYNESLFDLLSPDGIRSDLSVVDDGKGLSLCDNTDTEGGVAVRGLTYRRVSSEEEGLDVLFEGATNRSLAEHQLNKASSRSHCVVSIYVSARSK